MVFYSHHFVIGESQPYLNCAPGVPQLSTLTLCNAANIAEVKKTSRYMWHHRQSALSLLTVDRHGGDNQQICLDTWCFIIWLVLYNTLMMCVTNLLLYYSWAGRWVAGRQTAGP